MADRRDCDRGTTLTEVLIVLALSALVTAPLYGVIRSGFRQDEVQVEQMDREQQLRLVVSLISDDIRAGAPSDKRAGAAADELSLEVIDDRGDLQRVFWFVDGSTLHRRELDGSTSAVRTDVVLLDNVKVDGAVFRYWTAAGREITDGQRIASCAVRVTVSLRIFASDGDGMSSRVFDVAHRVANPEAEPC